MNKSYRNELQNLRSKKGWTQKTFADYLGIPLITYVQWENETRRPPQYVIDLIKFKCQNDTNQIKLDLNDQKHFKNTVLELLEKIQGKNYKEETDLIILKSYIREMI